MMVAFQVGNEDVHLEQGYGHRLSLVAHRRPTAEVGDRLRRAGLEVVATFERAPDATEKVPQAVLIARKPYPAAPSAPSV